VKYFIKKILYFIRDTEYFIYFLIRLLCYRDFLYTRQIRKESRGSVVVLANGPSLKEVVPLLSTSDRFKNVDFFVMNFFAFNDIFFIIKPKYYCLMDDMFYDGVTFENEKENVSRLFDLLENHVDWEINVYVVRYRIKDFMEYSKITNKHINIIGMNTQKYLGYKKFEYFFYKNNLAMPSVFTVANMALFVSMNSGYSHIYLYGFDHDFFTSLYVNDDNILCYKYNHFYEENDIVRPLLNRHIGKYGKPATIVEYLLDKLPVFVCHETFAKYAEYMGIKIVNCTKNSFIDSYERDVNYSSEYKNSRRN
jgi:hypothetical protein